MGFNNGCWLRTVYKNSSFFHEIMGHCVVPNATLLQRYLQYSIFSSLVSCSTSQFGKLAGNILNELIACL
jgi:hypothetical protein